MRTSKTLRRLPPETRKIARAVNDLEKALSRINRQIEHLAQMELDNLAWLKRQEHFRDRGEVDPLTLDLMDASMLEKVSKHLF